MAFETKFRLEKSSKMLRFLHVMQAIVRHSIDRVIFISAEDYDGMTKMEPFYSRLQKVGVDLDIREYKYKSFQCGNCKTKGKQKVQAEVDVAIAVRMIDAAKQTNVRSITLFAGDRDFYDAIRYVQEDLGKPVQILAYRDNFAQRLILLLGSENVNFLNDYWPILNKMAGAKNLLPDDFEQRL